MGDPKKIRRIYDSPRRPWDKQRIVSENDLSEKYGLTNKKEILIVRTIIRNKRQSARNILSLKSELADAAKKELVGSLAKYGILTSSATVDDVLSLKVEDFFERRLQTLVLRKGLATTPKQARQFVTHGFIEVGGSKVRSPGYLVLKSEEDSIGYYRGIKPKILDAKEKAPEMQQAAIDAKSNANDQSEEIEG